MGAAVLAVLLLFVVARLYRYTFDAGHQTARGAILEARIVQSGALESSQGEVHQYQIEARVRYLDHGQVQERWLPVNLISSREVLESRLAQGPKECEVYWTLGRPEQAKCRFYEQIR